MLSGLNIRNMLLIDALDLEFQAGLNVLTGETGAGKSILLDSLGFVLGWRGRADMVRSGADLGEVSAWFDLTADHPAQEVLREAGLPQEATLFLRRTNTPDGRKIAYVNDRRCSGDILRRLSACLVELHGQHDDRGLLNASGHKTLLDTFAGHDLTKIRTAWRALIALEKQTVTARAELEAMQQDAQYIRHSVQELEILSPRAVEDQELDARRRLMQVSARICEDLDKAQEALGPNAAEGMMTDAGRWLQGVADDAEGHLDEPLSAIMRALNELANAQSGLAQSIDQLQFDAVELEQVEERLFAIRALARKHMIQPDELPILAIEMAAKLTALDFGEDRITALEADTVKAQEAYDKLAEKLYISRSKAGRDLDARMAKELVPLKMDAAIFTTKVTKADQGPDGADTASFTVSTNPGAPAGPIDKIASGGELSRFLLALKVCLTSRADGLTLIFDEIDRGVGGATADAVGRRLSKLADNGQILVVTHSPQVAAYGDHHWLVSKTTDGQETLSSVEKLNATARTDEVARMLAGDVITDQARAAARALLD